MQSVTEAVIDAVQASAAVLMAVAFRSLSGAPGDLTLSQFRVLVVLARVGPQRPSDLAAQLDILTSSASRMSDRLVRKGLVARSPAVDNRREVRLSLTDDGERSVDMVTRARRREILRIVDAVPPSGREVLITSLRAFAAAAGEVPEQAWSLGWGL